MTKAELVARFQASVRLLITAREEMDRARTDMARLDADLMELLRHVDELVEAGKDVPDEAEIPFEFPEAEGPAAQIFLTLNPNDEEE